MKNEAGHVIREELNKSALYKLANFCSVHSLLKRDEELRDSFENFLAGNHKCLENTVREDPVPDFEAIVEILPVLYELGDQLIAGGHHEVNEISQADSSNRLYASLKRHPE